MRTRFPLIAIVLAPALLIATTFARAQQKPGSPATEARTLRPLSLAEAIDAALAGNAELAISEARRDVAGTAAVTASAALYPGIGVEAGYMRSVDPVVAFGTKLRQGTFDQRDFDVGRLNDPGAVEDWTAGVGVRWTILDPRVWTARASARHRAQAARWSTRRTREATVLLTRVLYYRAWQTTGRSASAEAAVAAARATLETFRARRDRGLLTDADVLPAEAELRAGEARRADARRARTDALQELGLHLGWDPDSLPVPADSLTRPQPPEAGGERPDGRADLRALAAVIDAAGAAKRGAALSFVPSVDIGATYTTHAADAFASDATDWTVNVTLRWTLFAGLSRAAGLQRAGLEQRIARIEYARAVRDARGQIASAVRAVASARRQVEATRAAREAAAAARDLMRRRFEEGLATAADRLQAEARAIEMRERAIDALAAYHTAIARLEFVRAEPEPESR